MAHTVAIIRVAVSKEVINPYAKKKLAAPTAKRSNIWNIVKTKGAVNHEQISIISGNPKASNINRALISNLGKTDHIFGKSGKKLLR